MVPSAFNGTLSNNPKQWLTEIDRYFKVASMSESDPRRVLIASTYLKESAATWYSTVAGENLSWEDFKDRFNKRWQPLAASKVARAALRNLKHRTKVAGYNQEFQKLMQQIENMSVTDQIENYIMGLQRHIALKVDEGEPETLSEAMEIAQRTELMNLRHASTTHYGRGPYTYFPSRGAGGSGGQGSVPMDLTAIAETLEEEPPASEDPFSYDAYMHFLNAMHFRGGHRGPFRGGARGRGGYVGNRQVNGLSREEFDKLSRERKCFKCKKTGHLARNCSVSGSGSSDPPQSKN
jgi:hypothetical protein